MPFMEASEIADLVNENTHLKAEAKRLAEQFDEATQQASRITNKLDDLKKLVNEVCVDRGEALVARDAAREELQRVNTQLARAHETDEALRAELRGAHELLAVNPLGDLNVDGRELLRAARDAAIATSDKLRAETVRLKELLDDAHEQYDELLRRTNDQLERGISDADVRELGALRKENLRLQNLGEAQFHNFNTALYEARKQSDALRTELRLARKQRDEKVAALCSVYDAVAKLKLSRAVTERIFNV